MDQKNWWRYSFYGQSSSFWGFGFRIRRKIRYSIFFLFSSCFKVKEEDENNKEQNRYRIVGDDNEEFQDQKSIDRFGNKDDLINELKLDMAIEKKLQKIITKNKK